jgi:2-polyprenyl-3-methyl-5-hydroxy-6-metoxy-1,4-benzoquinol methylase
MEETKGRSVSEESTPAQIAEMHQTWRTAMRNAAKVQKIYNEYLTRVDQTHDISTLEESAPVLRELQKNLNELFNITNGSNAVVARRFSRTWFKQVLSPQWWRKKWFLNEVHPVFTKQKEFNSATVHLLNEVLNYFFGTTKQMRELLEAQILYFQQITPWIDVKFRELQAQQNHNLAYNLAKVLAEFDSSDHVLHRILEQFHSLESQINERSLAAERRLQELWFQMYKDRTPVTEVSAEAYDAGRIRVEMEELRSKLDKLTTNSPTNSDPVPVQQKPEYPLSADFRYFVFEEIFRGASAVIKDRFREYVPYFLMGPEPVLDIGCGRGEFLQLMKEIGKDGYGIETNQYNIQKAVEQGLRVLSQDIATHLQDLQPESIGSVFCTQVIEHLPPEEVFRMLSRLHLVMKSGSALVLETVNPLSVFAYHHVYFKDPTHIFPVHPQTLVFLLRYVGFEKVEFHPITPVPESQKLQPPPNMENEKTYVFLKNLTDQLNQLLYSNIEYYVVGYRT